uniref:PHD finger protein 21B n=1 Tax=Xiphophorus maculatus TaxID=8083 RepID=A0A3B5R4M3_XIPMA
MVTAHINGQKAAGPEPLQASPINLQAAGAGVVPFSGGRRAGELLAPSQMLGTLTALPIKVPQVSSLHRLAGQAATVLPQVRPKTQIPDSLPHSPCQELQPLSLQRVTAVVSPKSQAPTLPTANSTFSSDHQQVSQSNASPSAGPDLGHASAGPGVAYAIIAASPATGKGVSAVSEAVKVIIIQPQAPSSTDGSPADLPSPEAPTVKSPPKKKKKEEDPEVNQLYYSGSTAGELMEPGSDSSSSVAENRLHGGPWPRYHRAAGRDPDEEAGEEEEKHSQPSLQRHLGARAETPAVTLPEQLPLPVGTRRSWSMTTAAPSVRRTESCSSATTALEPSTPAASTRPSEAPPEAPGTAPSARRRS